MAGAGVGACGIVWLVLVWFSFVSGMVWVYGWTGGRMDGRFPISFVLPLYCFLFLFLLQFLFFFGSFPFGWLGTRVVLNAGAAWNGLDHG